VGYYRAVVDLKVGDKLAEGDKVGEVVALGLANDVTALGSGEIAEVCVADGEAVEFGQKLLLLRP
jgi:biotin carboxyl carrier protein